MGGIWGLFWHFALIPLPVTLCLSFLVCSALVLRPQCLVFPFPLNLYLSLWPHSSFCHFTIFNGLLHYFTVRWWWWQLLCHTWRPVIGSWRGTGSCCLLQSTRRQEIQRKVYSPLHLVYLYSVKALPARNNRKTASCTNNRVLHENFLSIYEW